jgi:uncharacterized protein (DUF1501 family)
MKRRDFIKHLPIGVAAASIPFSVGGFNATAFARNPALDALLNPQSDNGKILVLINLSGGNDGLNTVIPHQDPLYYNTYRPTLGFNPSIQADKAKLDVAPLRGDLSLNPMFQFTDTAASRSSKMHDMWKEGKLAIIQNVGYDDSNRSHFRSTDIWNTATDSNVIMSTGWLGRYLEKDYRETKKNEPPYIEYEYPFGVDTDDDPLAISIDFNSSNAFQGSKINMGIAVADPSKYTSAVLYTDDPVPATNYGDELGYVRNILVQSDLYGKRFNDIHFPGGQTPGNKVTYPAGNSLAQQLRKVAWCIARGMKTKVYFVTQGGYDTHIQQRSKTNETGQGRLLFELAEAISLFQEDIEKFGVADKVLGMTYSEFGRRVNENGSEGTDHGTCAPQFLFGTGVNGNVYGNNPSLTDLDMYQDLKHQFDFRQLYASVLTEWFGPSETFTKSVLNTPDLTKKSEFGFTFPVNGTGEMRSLFKNPTGVSEGTKATDRIFILSQNYPNPVVSETTIQFALSESATVKLEVFDSRGELVGTPVNDHLGRGEHPINFDTRRLASGTYYYRLDVNGAVETKAMKVVR